MKGAGAVALLLSTLATSGATAQTFDIPLASDISAVQTQIRQAEEESERYSAGLVKSFVALRLATLRQTLALLDQRSRAARAQTTLHYTVEGKPFVPPSDTPVQIAAVETELRELSAKVTKQEVEVARYSRGLIQATAIATLAILRQTQAMLEQKRLALKYGLPQFVGFADLPPPGGSTAREATGTGSGPTRSGEGLSQETAAAPLPSDCVKVVFSSFCLGAPLSTLPPRPARKGDDVWIYAEPQPTAVTLVENRVAVVLRFYTPGTWLTYQGLERDLVEKYGKGRDLSFFPSYADDASSRETAISLKKGRAARSWEQQGFTVQLKWESSEQVVLLYFHDELEAKRAAEKRNEF